MNTILTKSIKLLIPVWVLFLFSCEDKNDIGKAIGNEITIVIPESAPAEGYPKRTIAFNLDIAAGAGLAKIEQRRNFEILPGSEVTDFEDAHHHTYPFTYTPDESEIGKTHEFTIVATDERGYSRTAKYRVSIEEPVVNVSITIPQSAPAEIAHKGTVDFDIPVTSEFSLSSIDVYADGDHIPEMTKTSFQSPQADIYDFIYVAEELAPGQDKTVSFTIVVTDELGQTKTAEYELLVKGPRMPKPIVRLGSVKLGGSSNATVTDKFVDAHNGDLYKLDAAAQTSSAKIDIAYYVSSSNATVICNPADNTLAGQFVYPAVASWPVRNNTRFVQVPDGHALYSSFDLITDDELIYEAYQDGTHSGAILKAQAGKIIVFRTVDGLMGALRITQESGTNKAGTVTFDLVSQQP